MNIVRTSLFTEENARGSRCSTRTPSHQTHTLSLDTYRQRVQNLEHAFAKAQHRLSNDQFEIQQLTEAIAALTQENVYLRGKITHFLDPGELDIGLQRTADLLRDQTANQTAEAPVMPMETSQFTPEEPKNEGSSPEYTEPKEPLKTLPNVITVQKLGPAESVESYSSASSLKTQRVSLRSRRKSKIYLKKFVPSHLRAVRRPKVN